LKGEFISRLFNFNLFSILNFCSNKDEIIQKVDLSAFLACLFGFICSLLNHLIQVEKKSEREMSEKIQSLEQKILESESKADLKFTVS